MIIKQTKTIFTIALMALGCLAIMAQPKTKTRKVRTAAVNRQLPISSQVMKQIYEEVKTPYKYGMVVAPKDNYHKIDCPMVYREGGKWYMTYVVYNGKDGTDGRGYETWLATSDDLLHWNTLGRLLSYADQGWDMNQRAGYPALIDWTWNGSYEMASYKNRHWMSYFGGVGTGYEAVKAPLNMGMASTKQSITKATEWETSPKPVLSIEDKDAQWWEKLTHYKSTVYWDKQKTLGKPFVMFYNAGGINPVNNLKAERIGIALSSNMTSWKRLPLRSAKRPVGNPVFYHEAPGIITGDAQIVKFPHYYVMFYFSAYNPTRKYNAYNTFAVSRDLVNWQDWEGSDLIYPSKPYDDMFAHKSYVLKHDGVVYHFYCAVNTAGQRGIAVATNVPMGRSEVSFPAPEKKGKRNVLSLDKSWQVTFGKTTEDSITKKMGTFQVDVPNNLDDYYGYRQLKHGNLHGTATYQKSFSAHKQQGKRYFLQLEGVGTFATVKVNNKTYPKELVGRTCFTLDITEALRDGDNKMTVKVEHPAMQTNNPWPCGGCSSEWGFSEGSQPFGIYRPVSLIETDEVRVEPFGVHVWNNEKCDSVFVETEVKNYGKQAQEIELTSKFALSSGKTAFRKTEKVQLKAGETKVIRQSAAIADAHLWSLEDPYLYTLSTLIKRGGKTIDDVATPYGIRTISWPVLRNKMAAENGKQNDGYDAKDGRFYLNGKPVFINGTCDYEHLFGQSHAFSHEQIASRVKLMRQAGFNAFREAHQPHNLYYQQLLDEQGMLFWSQFSAHVWYDTSSFRNNFKRLLRRWIKERRNSPSVILWGIQNESVLPKDFTEECSEIIREMDPTARTMRAITTCNGGEGSDWNVIQNWSGTYGGTADHYDQELKQPNQLLNGEYGAWRTLGFSQKDAAQLHSDSISLAKAYTEDAFTALLGKKAMLAESAKDSVCGHFQWIFVSHENPGRVQPDEAYRRIDKVGPFNYKGLLSPWEQPTSAFYWYRDHYAKGTFASATDMNAQTVAKDTKTPTAADRNKDILKPADGYTYLYRVNCGGDALVDSYGSEWEQDDSIYSHSWAERFGMNPFTASQGHILSNIHGLEKAGSKTSASTKSQSSEDAKLFQYFRWGRHALNYQFAVPDGEYRVELYFAEPWLGDRYGAAIDCEGERIFDVAINDSVVVNDLDLWAEAGFAGACKKVAYVKVKGGLMTISFPEVKVGEAIISAIAIAAKGEVDAPRGDYKWFAAKPKSQMSKTYWADLDKDVVEKYPKELLPQDNDVFPAIRYKSKTAEWTITPGVAREYMMRFRYKNTTGEPQVGRLKIVDSKGIVLVDRDMTFPETPNKFKTIGTTTDSQINAGTYRVTVSGVKDVPFEYLEIQ